MEQSSVSAAAERRRLEEIEARREAEHAARLAAYQARTGRQSQDDYVLRRARLSAEAQLAADLDDRRREEAEAGTDAAIPWARLLWICLAVCGVLLAAIYASESLTFGALNP